MKQSLATLSVPNDLLIERLHKYGSISHPYELDRNEYILIKSPSGKKVLVWANASNRITLVKDPTLPYTGITARDARQAAFLHALVQDEIPVNLCIGNAGTGKTLLATAAALESYSNKTSYKIFLTKPAVMVGAGSAFGPVPGDIVEKFDPYVYSYKLALLEILGSKGAGLVDSLIQKQILSFIPIEMTRGCTFRNCTLIFDEAQNATWHEINTVVSRMGENSKIIILGDLTQIDAKMTVEDTGLYKIAVSKKFLSSPLTSLIELSTVYRSPICQLAYEIDQEIKNGEPQGGNRNR